MRTWNGLAMDFGGSSGRGILGKFNGEQLSMKEVHRFENYYVNQNGTYYWDVYRLYHETMCAITKVFRMDGKSLCSIGLDTWGTDYGLIDRNGQLLGNVRCMRNADYAVAEEVMRILGDAEVFLRTGIQTIPGNTLFQLYERIKRADTAVQYADKLLMLPNLLGYFLTGNVIEEYTMATTSMCFSHKIKNWDFELLKKLHIPKHLFATIHYAGCEKLALRQELQSELGTSGLHYVPVATHDTASAVAATPLVGNELFCSSGTWSLLGMESDEVHNSEKVRNANFSNEGTADGKIRLLKNIMGMWLIQECNREWRKAGVELSWFRIVELAAEIPLFESFVDTEQPEFYNAGNMINKIQNYCRRTNQKVPVELGEIACCIYQSIAMQYRFTRDQLEEITGKRFNALRITGGGCKNVMLDQFAADVLGIPVYCGPVEAASAGNLLIQCIAEGEVKNFEELREIVKHSTVFEEYIPKEQKKWQEGYQKYCVVTGRQ